MGDVRPDIRLNTSMAANLLAGRMPQLLRRNRKVRNRTKSRLPHNRTSQCYTLMDRANPKRIAATNPSQVTPRYDGSSGSNNSNPHGCHERLASRLTEVRSTIESQNAVRHRD